MKTYTIIAGVSGTGKSSFAGAAQWETIETTLDNPEAEQAVIKAHEHGCYIKMYYIALDTIEECLARVKNRVMRGGHNVSEAEQRRQFANRWDAVKKILPYCDETLFFDNDNGFVEVAEYRNGEVVGIGELRPDWLKELQSFLRCEKG